MDISHRFSEVLGQFNDVSPPTFQRLLDFFVKPRKAWVLLKFKDRMKGHLPRKNVDIAKLKFLHYALERRKAACYMFRLVRESLDETSLVLFTKKSHNESF